MHVNAADLGIDSDLLGPSAATMIAEYPKPAEEVYDARLLAALTAPGHRRDRPDRAAPHGSVNKGF